MNRATNLTILASSARVVGLSCIGMCSCSRSVAGECGAMGTDLESVTEWESLRAASAESGWCVYLEES